MSDQNRRNLTALIAIALIGFVVVAWSSGHWDKLEHIAAPALRTGIFSLVVWLAWFDILRLPKFLFFLVPVILLAIIIRPKLILAFIGIAIPVWIVLKTLQFFSTPHGKKK